MIVGDFGGSGGTPERPGSIFSENGLRKTPEKPPRLEFSTPLRNALMLAKRKPKSRERLVISSVTLMSAQMTVLVLGNMALVLALRS